MSLRFTLSLALSAAILLVCGALWWSSQPPWAAVIAAACAVAGACAARLWRDGTNRAISATSLTTTPMMSAMRMPVERARDGENIPASELLSAMMSSMREGLVVVDAETRVLAANPAARAIFGAGADAAFAHPRRLSDLTRNPAVLSAFAAVLESGERVEAKVETLNDARRAFDLRVAPLPRPSVATTAHGGNKSSSSSGAIGVFFDITRLEQLERVRQEFLSNVSHELRTPLTAIRTFVETLDAGALEDPAHNRRFLSIIERNAARMHALLDDILELSAIEAGTVYVEPARVRLRPLVADVLAALAPRAMDRRITLHNEVDEGTAVHADARRLEQMITNLADNAIKFNRDGGTVYIGHEFHGERDRVYVADTGDGIAPEHAGRIFERFYRVDRARSRNLGGTGLGLAIVKHLARAHGGEATVQSTPGQGSTFTLELPRAEDK